MTETPTPFQIRACQASDAEALVRLVRELAVYEKLEDQAKATPEAFREHLFGPTPAAEALLVEVNGEPIGFAIFFKTFSTFRGQPGHYLEDLYVKPEYRGQGIGKALLASVAKLALERGSGRLEWAVLDWNAPSIGFYRSLGARPMEDWTVYRVDEQALTQLAATGGLLDAPETPLPTGGLQSS